MPSIAVKAKNLKDLEINWHISLKTNDASKKTYCNDTMEDPIIFQLEQNSSKSYS